MKDEDLVPWAGKVTADQIESIEDFQALIEKMLDDMKKLGDEDEPRARRRS